MALIAKTNDFLKKYPGLFEMDKGLFCDVAVCGGKECHPQK
jgi:hypothetical protein